MKFRNGVVAALLLAASGTVHAQGWFHNDDHGGGGWWNRGNQNENGDVSDNQRQACEPDAFRVCGRYIPDRNAISDCLHRNVDRLSPACRAVMEGRLK